MTTLASNLIPDGGTARAAEPAEVCCAHCGLAVPPDMLDQNQPEQFCCVGCRAVYSAIRGAGLEDYYAIRKRIAKSDQSPARTSGDQFSAFDDPNFSARYADGDDRERTIHFYLDGMHCPACVWLIEQLPRVCPGVYEARVNLGTQSVSVRWSPDQTTLGAIARKLDAFGYTPHAYKQRALHEHRRIEDRRSLVRIAVAGAIAGNVMLISFALYGGMLHGMDAIYQNLFHVTCAGLTGLAVAWPGRVFFTGAWRALRAGRMHMDVPVAVGLSAGTIWSAFAAALGMESVYFDSMTVLVFLLLIGRWVQQRQQRRSQDALEMLFTITPSTARVRRGNAWVDVAAETIAPGDIVRVLPGETIPADGMIRSGESSMDMALLSGESKPVRASRGDEVAAGSVNLSSPITVEITAAGEKTRIAQIMRLVERAAHRRAPVVALADRIAGWFVITILALACLTAGMWAFVDAASAVEHAIALLIITCPCALGLATPLALMTGIGQAAKRRMLIKGGDVIEQLTKPGVICFDKTGTLTHGELRIIEWFGEPAARTLIASLEAESTHVIAHAVRDAAGDDAPGPKAERVIAHHGLGIEGRVQGHQVRVGSLQFIDTHHCGDTAVADAIERAQTRGHTVVLCERDGVVIGGMSLSDTVRKEARDVIESLRARGWRVGIISGDTQHVVDDVADQLGLDRICCRGGVSPEGKLALMEELRGQTVVMVGDGVNDAAALAAADVGVAVSGSAEAAMAAADIYLARGIGQLPELAAGAQRCFGTIRRNLLVSLLYNVAGVSLAVAGLINPIVAAILMPASSLTVMTMSFRAKIFDARTLR